MGCCRYSIFVVVALTTTQILAKGKQTPMKHVKATFAVHRGRSLTNGTRGRFKDDNGR